MSTNNSLKQIAMKNMANKIKFLRADLNRLRSILSSGNFNSNSGQQITEEPISPEAKMIDLSEYKYLIWTIEIVLSAFKSTEKYNSDESVTTYINRSATDDKALYIHHTVDYIEYQLEKPVYYTIKENVELYTYPHIVLWSIENQNTLHDENRDGEEEE